MRIVYVYKWATMGGVERVILNRVHALKYYKFDDKVFIHFLEDYGGVQKMKDYLKYHDLEQYAEVISELDPTQYDLVVSIDTPEIIEKLNADNLVMECHTHYANNRSYLHDIQRKLNFLVVPSSHFKETIAEEFPLLKNKILVLDNFVFSDQATKENNQKIFADKIPILWLGRVDQLKNALEIIEIVASAKLKFGDRFVVIFAGSILMPEARFYKFLDDKGLNNRFIHLPHVGFHKINQLLSLIKLHKGIFVSASTGETFGMSAAEAMSAGVPVLLSDIEAHHDLVQGNKAYLYKLHDINNACTKLLSLVSKWDNASNNVEQLAKRFGPSLFLEEWKLFKSKVHSKDKVFIK